MVKVKGGDKQTRSWWRQRLNQGLARTSCAFGRSHVDDCAVETSLTFDLNVFKRQSEAVSHHPPRIFMPPSALPTAYYLTFRYFEPLVTTVGFIGALLDPKAVRIQFASSPLPITDVPVRCTTRRRPGPRPP